MMSSAHHTWIAGARSADRVREAGAMGPPDVSANCHRRLRGPYSGVSAALDVVVRDAYRYWPDLVDEHRVSLLHAVPDLCSLIGPPVDTLTSSTPHEERTRFFGQALARCVSHGVVSFLDAYGQRRDSPPLVLFFDEVHHADPTEQEFLGLALRRADPGSIHLIVGTGDGALPEVLNSALHRYAQRIDAAESPSAPPGCRDEELVRRFVASTGPATIRGSAQPTSAAGQPRGRCSMTGVRTG